MIRMRYVFINALFFFFLLTVISIYDIIKTHTYFEMTNKRIRRNLDTQQSQLLMCRSLGGSCQNKLSTTYVAHPLFNILLKKIYI